MTNPKDTIASMQADNLTTPKVNYPTCSCFTKDKFLAKTAVELLTVEVSNRTLDFWRSNGLCGAAVPYAIACQLVGLIGIVEGAHFIAAGKTTARGDEILDKHPQEYAMRVLSLLDEIYENAKALVSCEIRGIVKDASK